MSYTSHSIQVLKGLEACRTRPGMYIGNTQDGSGLHHMVYEVLDNAIDEALAGFCNKITLKIDNSGYAIIEDDGRGIPIDIHEGEGISAAEVIMTQLHAGGKFDQNSYKVSGGLHGVGVSVVNALSDKLELTIWRDGGEFYIEFEKGITKNPLKEVGKSQKKGTRVRFLPDATIFGDITLDIKVLAARIEELAFLNPGLNIEIKDERDGYEKKFFEPKGIRAFVEKLSQNKNLMHEAVTFDHEDKGVTVKGGLVWSDSYSEEVRCFTNTIPQADGGTHLVGLRTGLTRCVQNYMQKENIVFKKQKDTQITGDDIREGIICVVAVNVYEPQFSSQTKSKLVSANVRPVVESAVSKAFEDWFEKKPVEAKKIMQRIMDAAEAREAARKARDLTRKNKSVSEFNLSMATKLAGCAEKDPSKAELFIVEGDSAGGSAKQARNRLFQAVLPLRGKILNVEKASFERMLNYDGIRTLIAVLGTGIGETFDITKIRYNKIIIMTDADVDGSHILSLLLTFFFKYMRPVLENGYVYIAQPPLYGIKHGQKMNYLLDDRALADFLLDRSIDKIKISKNGNIIEDSQTKSFVEDLFEIAPDLKKRGIIFQAACSAKMIDFDTSPEGIENLLKHLKIIKNGTWKFENDSFVHEKNGMKTSHGMKFDQLPPNYAKFISTWGQYWGNGVKIINSGSENEALEPMMIYDIFNQKGVSGLHIQRYKGLGEMNPEDLATTAMQSFLQVRYEDEAEADEIITKLMGDEVEPRRAFIEEIAPLLEADI